MQTIESPSVAADHRIINRYAAEEAAVALRTTAGRTQDAILALAGAVLRDDDVARQRFRNTVASSAFRTLVPGWVHELRAVASLWPDSGACTLATALELWSWTADHAPAQAFDELADAAAPLLAGRCLALEVAVDGGTQLRRDLSHVYVAHVASLAGAACAEIVFGYRRHLVWDAEGCAACYGGDEVDELEAVMPGFASGARMSADVVEADGAHPAKRGPCARFDGVEPFVRLRNKLDGCLTGSRLAKDRAAAAIARRS